MPALRVLFVEDSEADAALETEELRRRGFEVSARVVGGSAALADALRESWDLVLCDWNVPGFDALSALEMVKAQGKETPFIIVSGSVGEEIAVSAMRAGAHDYILKQNLARLGAAVERELREAQVRRERRDAVAALQKSFEEQGRLVRQLESALRARDELLSVASHELKTPLTALVLQVERLRRSLAELPEPLSSSLPAIDRQVKRITELIDGVLDVAQLQAGPLELHPEEVELCGLVREAAAPMAELQQQMGGVFELALPGPVRAVTDRTQLARLMAHLFSNAVKYGEGKPVRVELRVQDGRAVLRVSDHGPGIAADDQQRIFERFERAAPSHGAWGFGLGLWLARQIAVALGGELALESSSGQGSTFAFTMPLRRASS